MVSMSMTVMSLKPTRSRHKQIASVGRRLSTGSTPACQSAPELTHRQVREDLAAKSTRPNDEDLALFAHEGLDLGAEEPIPVCHDLSAGQSKEDSIV